MNRFTYFGQKNDVFGAYIQIASDFPSQHLPVFNDSVSVSQQWSSEPNDSPLANRDFAYSLKYSSNIITYSIYASILFSCNTTKNIRLKKKILFKDIICNSIRDCASRIDNEPFTHFIGYTNL